MTNAIVKHDPQMTGKVFDRKLKGLVYPDDRVTEQDGSTKTISANGNSVYSNKTVCVRAFVKKVLA